MSQRPSPFRFQNELRLTRSNEGPSQPDYYSAGNYEASEPGATAETDSRGPAHYWQVLNRNKGTLLLFAVLGSLTALFVTRVQTPMYRARMLIEIEDLNADFLNMRSVSPTSPVGSFQSPDYAIRTQTTVLQSRPVLERAVDRMDLEKRLVASDPPRVGFRVRKFFAWRKSQPTSNPPKVPMRDRAVAVAVSGLKVRPLPTARVIEVTFDSPDPQVAADFTNSVAAGFTEFSLEKRWQNSRNTSEWLGKQLADVKSKLEKAEDALQAYASGSDLTFISDKDNSSEERLRQLALELLKAQEDRVAKQSMYELATSVPAESLPAVLDDATLKDYQIQLTTLRQKLAELSSTFTAESPKVINVQAQIKSIEGALEKKRSDIVSRIRNEYSAASRREKLLSADHTSQVGVVAKQASGVAHYSVLKREVDTNRQLYDSMIQRVREAGLASAMRASELHVIEAASTPGGPYSPNALLNTAFGLLCGVSVAAALIIRRTQSYRGIQDPGHTAIELNVPELGVIPADTEGSPIRRLLGMPKSQGPSELMMLERWPSAIAESFRLTLTSILLSGKNGARPRVIVLTSATPGEGKTTVISNLGIALARSNRRVLLIDGDLRRPRLHTIFEEVDNSAGLSELLHGNASVGVQETKIPNLFLLPSGQSADEKLFFTSRVRQLFRRFKSEFDMILVDTPPLLQVSDARLMGHHADAVILVVAQHTDRDAVLMARQRLAEDGSYLLGTILNNWDRRTSSHGFQHYGDYYYSSDNRVSGIAKS